MTDLTKKGVAPVPQPLYCSTAQDRQAAGVDFIFMSYVEVWVDSESECVHVCMHATIMSSFCVFISNCIVRIVNQCCIIF